MTTVKSKTCFWLNIYNFLVIFTVIYKKEVISNYYEWYRFIKNSYYNIGGYDVSLYEIDTCILRGSQTSKNIYGEVYRFPDSDPKSILLLEKIEKDIFYGISLPTKSSPRLQVYFPNTLTELLKLNAIDYFNRGINVDMDSCMLTIPEYVTWVDPKIAEHIFDDLE